MWRKSQTRGQVRVYSDLDYEFGYDNLREMPTAFTEKIKKLLKNMDKYLNRPNLQEESREDLESRKNKLQGIIENVT